MNTWKLKKKRRHREEKKPWAIRIVAIVMLLATFWVASYDFPQAWNKVAASVHETTGIQAPILEEESFRLGLDLQGGTHLIYEANMNEIPEEDRVEALEGVRDVLERRVNSFGVSEPVVQTTSTGGAYRVILELAGITDVNEAISLIGQTPVLEFKSPGAELERDLNEEEQNQLQTANEAERVAANAVLDRAVSGEDFASLIQEFTIEPEHDARGVFEDITSDSQFGEFAIIIEENNVQINQVYPALLENPLGINIFKLTDIEKASVPELSHILICYEGTANCQEPIPEIEALAKINSILEQATHDAMLPKRLPKTKSNVY